MYGYIEVYKPELKFKEYDVYHSYYCGLCHILKKKYGITAQMTIRYDMVFLILLLTGLYDSKTSSFSGRCPADPKKHLFRYNEFTEYAADMQILTIYLKALDDWSDERKISGFAQKSIFSSKAEKNIKKSYPDKYKNIMSYLDQLHEAEEKEIKDYNIPAEISGKIFSEIFDYKNDFWQESLRRTGFYLGKFVYIIDAFDDVERDIRKKSFNPLKNDFQTMNINDFTEKYYNILVENIAECTKEVDFLPIIENSGIIKNILYFGVWNKFSQTEKKRRKKNG